MRISADAGTALACRPYALGRRTITPFEPDLPRMRREAQRVLGWNSVPLTSMETADMCRLLRGNVAVLIPQVQASHGASEPLAVRVLDAARRELDRDSPSRGRERISLIRLAAASQLLLDLLEPSPGPGHGHVRRKAEEKA
jgi:hypothetical protein